MAHKHISAVATALAGMLILSASSFARDDSIRSDTDTTLVYTAEVHRELARKAIADAAVQAIESVLADNKQDLDIRLIGPTSVKIASEN